MTAACDVPCVNNRAASNRRASNAALRRCPCCGVVMPQHRMVPDDNHHFISRDSLVVPATARAAVFFGPGKPFEIREVPIPEVDANGVLIRVTTANICGSDLHFWRGDAPLRLPEDGWIFGHEMTGRVAKLGSRIKADSLGRPLKEGDRVAYTYFYPCGRCYACLNKEPAACPHKLERPLGPSTPPHLHGAFADHYYLRPG